MSRPTQFLHNAQALRFIAAMLVLVGHVLHEVEETGEEPWVNIPWAFGVDVFFVISGFIMVHTFGRRFGEPGAARDFLRRRILRIVPAYWTFTTLMVAAIAAMPALVDRNDLSPLHVAASYLFIPWESPAGGVAPVLVLGWTLNLEMFFYVAFAAALATGRRRLGLTGLGVLFVGLALAHRFIPQSWTALHFWSDPIILEFLGGVGLGLVFERGVRLRPRAAVALGLVAVALLGLLTVAQAPRVASCGLPAVLLAAALLLAPQPQRADAVQRLVRLSGDASYALYLSHPFTLTALAAIYWGAGFESPWAYVALAIVASVAAAIGFYLVVERPLRLRLAGVRPARSAGGAARGSREAPGPRPVPAGATQRDRHP